MWNSKFQSPYFGGHFEKDFFHIEKNSFESNIFTYLNMLFGAFKI